jgi:hypothetical protein
MRVAYVAHPTGTVVRLRVSCGRIRIASSPVEHCVRRAALSFPSKGNKLSSKNDEGRFVAAVVLKGPPTGLSRSVLFSCSNSFFLSAV